MATTPQAVYIWMAVWYSCVAIGSIVLYIYMWGLISSVVPKRTFSFMWGTPFRMKILFFFFTTVFATLRLSWSIVATADCPTSKPPPNAPLPQNFKIGNTHATDIYDWGSIVAICAFTCVVVYFHHVLRDTIRLDQSAGCVFNISVTFIAFAVVFLIIAVCLEEISTITYDLVLSLSLIVVALAFLHFGMRMWRLVCAHYPRDGDAEELKKRIRRLNRSTITLLSFFALRLLFTLLIWKRQTADGGSNPWTGNRCYYQSTPVGLVLGQEWMLLLPLHMLQYFVAKVDDIAIVQVYREGAEQEYIEYRDTSQPTSLTDISPLSHLGLSHMQSIQLQLLLDSEASHGANIEQASGIQSSFSRPLPIGGRDDASLGQSLLIPPDPSLSTSLTTLIGGLAMAAQDQSHGPSTPKGPSRY